MLTIKVDVVNEKVVLERIAKIPTLAIGAARAAMTRVGKGVMAEAYDWLSGSKSDTGGSPVPVVTGNLRRLLDWVKPGESVSAGGQTVTAGPHETIIYDSAAYSFAIAKGRGSSAKYGPRDYLAKALDAFNAGDRIVQILDEEIERALA